MRRKAELLLVFAVLVCNVGISPVSGDSHISIGAIKSVSGVKPDDEFFDITLRASYGNWSALTSFDIALSVADTSPGQKEFTEGIALLGRKIGTHDGIDKDGNPATGARQTFAGAFFKQFDGAPDWGLGAGVKFSALVNLLAGVSPDGGPGREQQSGKQESVHRVLPKS